MGFVFFGVVSRKCFLSVSIFGVSVFSAGNGFVEGDRRAAVWRGGIGRFSFAVGQGGGGFLCGSDCLALGSVVAGEKVAGVGLAAAGAQAGVGSVAGEIGGVVVSVVIVVGAGGGLELLFGADVALDGESF